MIRPTCTLILLLSFAGFAYGQKWPHIHLSGGASFRNGALPQIGGDEVTMQGSTPIKNRVEFRLGDGMSWELNVGALGDSISVGYGFGLAYLNGYETRFAENDPDTLNNTYAYTALRNEQIQFKPNIWFPFRIGSVKFNTMIGGIIPIRNNTWENTYWDLNSGSGKEVRRINYHTGAGLYFKQELMFSEMGPFSIMAGLEYGIQNARRKYKKIESYSDDKGRGIMEAYPNLIDRELEYVPEDEQRKLNDPKYNPNFYNKNSVREAYSTSDFFNYIGFSVRLVYVLN